MSTGHLHLDGFESYATKKKNHTERCGFFLVDDIGLEPMTFRTSKVFVPFGMSPKGKKDPNGTYMAQSESPFCRIPVVLFMNAMSKKI